MTSNLNTVPARVTSWQTAALIAMFAVIVLSTLILINLMRQPCEERRMRHINEVRVGLASFIAAVSRSDISNFDALVIEEHASIGDIQNPCNGDTVRAQLILLSGAD